MTNKERKVEQAKNKKPINFKCGGCRGVFPYKGSYECPSCGYGKDPVHE